MKIKPLILLLSSFLLVACSNGNQETAEKSFGEKAKTTKVSKESSSKSENSSESTSETEKTNEELYADIIASYPTEYASNYHAFYDINKDGVDEMFIGDSKIPEAFYYIVDGKPQRLGYSYIASAGGSRKSFQVFDNGYVVQCDWYSGNGRGNATVFNLLNDGNEAEIIRQEKDIQIVQLAPIDLEIQSQVFDLTKLKWIQEGYKQNFDSQYVEANEHSSIVKEETIVNSSNENTDYKTDLFPSAYNPNEENLRDGFYIAPANNISIISQYTDMKETDQVTVKNEDRDSFLDWIRQTAPDGTTKNGLKSNYDYWVKNVK
ncbi:hypothetical protein [Streptococcus parauberis]|uniref:hypothetical protein n=1 Tax=Streptococcus parauberis TaxID=1348 RepID=UPI000CCDE2B0|nr:hypothetical protein [Streptococcus parauberis]PNY18714.1 hypothetical protein ASN86_01668 [Streptococcus parauberis]